VEFGSLLHQLSADMVANPYSPALHKVLLEISPEAKANLPKRPAKAAPAEPAAEVSGRKLPVKKPAEKKPAAERGKPAPTAAKRKPR
jgi:hypothetical protein